MDSAGKTYLSFVGLSAVSDGATNMNSEKAVHQFADKCNICGITSTLKCSSCKTVAYCGKIHQKLDWKTHKHHCGPFKVKSNSQLGRHLVANRDILINEIISKENPLVIGPKFIDPHPVCLGCLQPIRLKRSERCVKCTWPACRSTCVGLLNGYHKEECDILAKIKLTSDYRYETITPLRCLLLKNNHPKKWNVLMSLESHLEYRTPETEIYQDIEKVAYYVMELFTENSNYRNYNEDDVHRICGILEVNSLDVPIDDDVSLSAIYESFSLIEHNCLPNVKISFNNNHELTVKASRNILKNQNISTMYTNCLWGTKLRRDHLMATKYFRCCCSRCADSTEFGTNFSALKCLIENNTTDTCPGYILPVTPLLDTSIWKCSHCSLQITDVEVDSIIEQLSSEIEKLTEEAETVPVRRLEEMLEKLYSLLHPNHYHCVALKHTLIQAYGHRDGYKHDQLPDYLLEKKRDYCRELLATLNALDPNHVRIPLYIAVVYYELSSAILEDIRRKKLNKNNRTGIEIDINEVKLLMGKTFHILKEEVYPSPGFQLSQCCQRILVRVNELNNHSNTNNDCL